MLVSFYKILCVQTPVHKSSYCLTSDFQAIWVKVSFRFGGFTHQTCSLGCWRDVRTKLNPNCACTKLPESVANGWLNQSCFSPLSMQWLNNCWKLHIYTTKQIVINRKHRIVLSWWCWLNMVFTFACQTYRMSPRLAVFVALQVLRQQDGSNKSILDCEFESHKIIENTFCSVSHFTWINFSFLRTLQILMTGDWHMYHYFPASYLQAKLFSPRSTS